MIIHRGEDIGSSFRLFFSLSLLGQNACYPARPMSAPGILNIAEYKYFISKFTIATSVTLSGGGAA